MGLVLDSFWRAVAYCLHPRVITLSLLPLAVMGALALGLGWLFWAPSVDAVSRWLEASSWVAVLADWLPGVMGSGSLRRVVAPLVVVALSTPVIVLGVLLVVAAFMTPAMVRLVADRRFPQLERRHGGSLLASVLWSLGSTLLALVALVVTIPLWLVPPFVVVLPALIWGWLTYRVMTFDALADHASGPERQELLRRHRWPLLGIGVATGLLGAAPGIVWASGVLFAAAFVILVPVAIWIYTAVFAFSSLWFGHYCLAALERLRGQEPAVPPGPPAAPPLALQDVQEP